MHDFLHSTIADISKAIFGININFIRPILTLQNAWK